MPTNALKHRLRATRDSLPEAHAVRMHRAISWLVCAEGQASNQDLQFISLWIAFNTCYGVDEERHQSLGERDVFQRFVRKLVQHDKDKKIYNCLWQKFSGPVKALINNPYVFQPFWEAQRLVGKETSGVDPAWEIRFEKSSAAAMSFLAQQKVPELMGVVLDRLYVLRNQLMHGGATWQSKVNRDQVRDGCHMLSVLMPIMVGIMLDANTEDWGEIYYPVVG